MEKLSQVMEFIDKTHHDETVDSSKYNEIRALIILKLQELDKNNYETIARLNYYLLLLGLKFDHINLEEADRLYLLTFNYFHQAEELIKKQVNSSHNKNKHITHAQLKYFYKLVEHYFNNLENIFREKYFFDHAKRAYSDKLHFKASQKLFEKELLDYFEYKREELMNKFRTHYIIYTLFGATGMVLFWKGVWDLAYKIPIIRSDLGSLFVGILLMTLTGFIASIGGRSVISTTDKFEE